MNEISINIKTDTRYIMVLSTVFPACATSSFLKIGGISGKIKFVDFSDFISSIIHVSFHIFTPVRKLYERILGTIH
jgi:hypothetical protein